MACFTSKKKEGKQKGEGNEDLDTLKLRFNEQDPTETKKVKPIRAFFQEYQEQSVLQLDPIDYTWLKVNYKNLSQVVKNNDDSKWDEEMQRNKEQQLQEREELNKLLEIMTDQNNILRELEKQKNKKSREVEELKKNFLRTLIKNQAIKRELINQQNKFADQVNLILNQVQEANMYY